MFDIREYYQNSKNNPPDVEYNMAEIESDISYDIDSLLNDRFDKLYMRDSYRHEEGTIEIISPKLMYPNNKSLLLAPDRIRFLLSFYPKRTGLKNIERIVLRPRYIEVGNIELLSLYMKQKKILVLYLYHPHSYTIQAEKFRNNDKSDEFVPIDIEQIMDKKLPTRLHEQEESPEVEETGEKKPKKVEVPPLWYILSTISPAEDDQIDKFFIKKSLVNNEVYEILNDISFYYSRHGY
ncbi:MAG: hypothetical protein GY754_28380 [bacterium]|nr:hypothetical protein [bacterium]